MKFAIIENGGKQYMVEEGKKVKLELMNAQEGDKVTLPFVVLYNDGENTEVGAPFVEGKKVEAEVTLHGRADKIRVVHKQPKKRLKTVKGHKQHFTEVTILSL